MMDLAANMPKVINFTVGQPDYDTPRHIIEACKEALDAGYTRYGPALGIPQLRQAVSRKLQQVNSIRADPDTQVIITVGAQEAITLAMLTILDPGDEVVMQDPVYTNYHGHIPMVSAQKVLVSAKEENGFLMMPADLEAAITPKTRLLLINSPCNPTGAVVTYSILQAYTRIAQKYNLAVISDEAYESLIYGDAKHLSLATFPGMAERTVSIYTFSKSYAMTGWRIGYMTGPVDLVNEMHKLQEEIVSCPVTFAQYGALAALNGPQDCIDRMVADYDQRRKLMMEGLGSIQGITFIEPQGAFYLFVNVASFGLPSTDLAMHLLTKSAVATVPGTAFGPGGEGYIRFCYASTSSVEIEEGIERMRTALHELE
jgi:aspartate/methionine/tyrosine aminotransferase